MADKPKPVLTPVCQHCREPLKAPTDEILCDRCTTVCCPKCVVECPGGERECPHCCAILP